MRPDVRVRRVYEAVAGDDGARVLVDRVWPRGLSKAAAHLESWDKDVAPSTELRVWYGHERSRFDEFRRRYLTELAEPDRAESVGRLRKLARAAPLTLLTATRDVDHSQATVLAEAVRARQTPKR